MRILFGLLDAGVGGGQQVAFHIAEELAGRGHRLGLVVPGPGPTIERFEELGAETHFADLSTLRKWRDAQSAAKILRNYDILYSHSSIPGEILGDVAARLSRRAHVVHRHTPPHLSPSATIERVQRILYRSLLRHRPFIAVADHIRRQVIGLGIDAGDVTLIPNGVDVDSVLPATTSDRRPVRVGLLGRFDPQKGMDVFARAIASLEIPTDDVDLVIGGSGGPFLEYEHDVRREANTAGIRVETPGREGIAFLSSLDVVVMPSRWEGMPLVLLEAMALRKAIIASNIEGIKEVLGDTGVLVPPEDPIALGRAIGALVSDEEGRRALGQIARARVVERFSLKRSIAAAADLVLAAADAKH